MGKKIISIFTPVYNESENIPIIYNEVKSIMRSLNSKYNYEHIFSDNASVDNSLLTLKKIQEDDSNVKIISLSKNFGVTKSTLNGLFNCTGDAIIQLDADLQDPPRMILDFIQKWEEGYKVVYGIRTDRDEKWLMKNIRKLYYRIAHILSDENLIPDVGEFRLMDKKIIMELKKIRHYNPYLRGVIANLGFKQTGIDYHRHDRKLGSTSTNLYRLFDYGINGIISHSTIMLRVTTLVGLSLTIISILMIMVSIYLRLFSSTYAPGLTTITILILFFSGIQMIFLGIIGEYIAKIFDQSIKRPIVIEKEKIGFDK